MIVARWMSSTLNRRLLRRFSLDVVAALMGFGFLLTGNSYVFSDKDANLAKKCRKISADGNFSGMWYATRIDACYA